MSITTAIILGLIISFLIIYVTLNIQKFRQKKKYEHQDLIDRIHSRIAKANGATIEQFSLENSAEAQKKKGDNLYRNTDFINKNCTSLEDFIISDEINKFDLRKLADLNQIQLQISEGWYPLTIQLIKELNENGWDKKVSCIKEKYARLEFYTHHEYNSPIHKIISKYGKKSEYVCETCSEKGEIRHNSGWDYVACRKHYLENRGKIEIENSGFNHNGNFYSWKVIKDASFEDLDFNDRYRFLTIEYKEPIVNHQGWTDNMMYVSKNTIGFGNFLNNLPKNFQSLNNDYLMNFENPEFCEICGYKAVYYGECECCENDNWEIFQKRWSNKDDEKNDHISYYQIKWTIDEGENYETKQNNYHKNTDYKILFTDEELQEHLEYLENEEED